MISYVRGKVIDKSDKFLVVETAGIGYKIFGTPELLDQVTLQGDISLWTHFAVRENSQDLYGFPSRKELDFFELLITISGIGPKSALNILSIANIETIQKAVASGDPARLTKVSGIGKKNAEKIVLELKGKFENIAPSTKEESDALEGLKALGYSYKEAREALKDVSPDSSTSEKIKEALKLLNN